MLIEEKEAEKILKRYKIPICISKICNSKKDVFSCKIEFPIVLKALSPKIIHKTDSGAVIVGIKNKTELRMAFEKFKKFGEINYLIQKQEEGKEIIIGMKRDAQFGPVILFGLGGVFVEVFKDVSFRIAPLSKKDIYEMINEIKAIKILKGFRGEKSVNLDKVSDILSKLSVLSLKEKHISEIDFNPVIVNETRAVVVDARLIKD